MGHRRLLLYNYLILALLLTHPILNGGLAEREHALDLLWVVEGKDLPDGLQAL